MKIFIRWKPFLKNILFGGGVILEVTAPNVVGLVSILLIGGKDVKIALMRLSLNYEK